MKKRIIALLTCIAVIISLICIVPESNAGIQSLNLSKQEKSIKVGESFQLTMSGIKASSIKWKSSKPGVATVSKKGIIKGIKAGTTNITGKYKNLKFTIKVIVTAKSAEQSAKKDKVYLGTCANVDIYYVTVKDNEEVVLYAVNKNKHNVYVILEYLNMDGKTSNFGGHNLVSANDSRTIEWYQFDGVATPQKTITGHIEVNNNEYNQIGELDINVTLK